MKHFLQALMLPTALLLAIGTAEAVGTPVGTDIVNQATATFTVGASIITQDSNPVTTTVAEILDVTLVWQDGGPVSVSPGAANQPLKFQLTNTGNGNEVYNLSINTVQPGDQFDPTFVSLYLDNGDGIYGPGDTLIPGGVLPSLAPDTAATFFVLSDIPGGVVDGDLGIDLVSAAAATGAGVRGTVFPGAGDGGVNAVVATNPGLPVSNPGSYVVSNVTVAVVKGATISDPFGGNQPVPSATITYTLTVTITGSGTATALTISDPIPSFTTYQAGTLRLNGALLSDGVDADNGEVAGTPAIMTVRLGDMTSAAGVQLITFDVKID